MTKKKQTYASQAKTIMNKYKLRLGDKFDKSDPLALASMNAELTALQGEQEEARMAELPTGEQQFANGGQLPEYGGFNFSQFLNKPNPKVGGAYDQMPATSAGAAAAAGIGGGGDGWEPASSNVSWLGPALGMVGGILSNQQLDLPTYEHEEWKPTQARANLVDYTRGREQTMRERDQANAMITRNARGTGSQQSLMENIIAGSTGTQRAAGSAFNQSLENEGNVNAQIKNQASQFNAAQAGQAAQFNARDKMYAMEMERENAMINQQRRENQIGAVTGSISGYMGDLEDAKNYDSMLDMMKPENYELQQKDLTPFQKFLQLNSKRRMQYDPNSRRNTAK